VFIYCKINSYLYIITDKYIYSQKISWNVSFIINVRQKNRTKQHWTQYNRREAIKNENMEIFVKQKIH